jgi:hypothetical protein
MVLGPGASSLSAMQFSVISSRSARPPDHELYDRGCDLVQAAASIRQLAADPRAARAVPAVLGCLDAALGELGGACISMQETTELAIGEHEQRGRKPRLRAAAERMRCGFGNLERALEDAEGAATAARSLAARSLGA